MRLLEAGDQSKILYHDPAEGPFREVCLETLFRAAKTRLNESTHDGCRSDYGIKIVAVVPDGVHFLPPFIRDAYLERRRDIIAGLSEESSAYARYQRTMPTAELWRVRLLPTEIALSAYTDVPERLKKAALMPGTPKALCLELFSRQQDRGKPRLLGVAFFPAERCEKEPETYPSPSGYIFSDLDGGQSMLWSATRRGVRWVQMINLSIREISELLP